MDPLFLHLAFLIGTADQGAYRNRWRDGEPMADVLISVLEDYNFTISAATANRYINALIVYFEGGDPAGWLEEEEESLLEAYRQEELFLKMESAQDPAGDSIAIWRHRWRFLKAIYLRLQRDTDKAYVLDLLQDVKREIQSLIQAWQAQAANL